jgi:hypothetical protein
LVTEGKRKWTGDEEKDVSSNWITLRKIQNTGV